MTKNTESKIDSKAQIKAKYKALLHSIRICDPAVGSGHFLVSALNEMIYIHYRLGLLDSSIEDLMLDNDEILIQIDNRYFEYKRPKSATSKPHRIQKALFHLKKEIIENNLFGVDINPNSAEITKLRLWIELLKNSYYLDFEDTRFHNLQTLPNIDINIKCGNSLVSNFPLDSIFTIGITKSFSQNLKTAINEYKTQVDLYKNALTDKKTIMSKITNIKNILRNYLISNDPINTKILNNLKSFVETYGDSSFDMESKFGMEMLKIIRSNKFRFTPTLTQLEPKEIDKHANKLLESLQQDFESLESLRNADSFEWRFEFPEVLDSKGDFMGFDLVIGNPPYISTLDLAKLISNNNKEIYKKHYPSIKGSYDIFILFILLGLKIRQKNGYFAWIIPNKFLIAQYAKETLNMLLEKQLLRLCVDVSNVKTFDKAAVYPIIILGNNNANYQQFSIDSQDDLNKGLLKKVSQSIDLSKFTTFKEYGIKIQSGLAGFQAHSIIESIREKKTKSSIPFAVSGSIDRYVCNTKRVPYMKNVYKYPHIVKNKSISTNKWNFWSNPKIIIAGMTKQLESVFIKTPLAIGVGVYAIYDFASLNPLLLLGILNSKFMNYVFVTMFKDKHLAGGYLGINKNNLELLPIPKIDSTNKNLANEIITLVDTILESKEKDSTTNTNELESKIDNLVYKLYNLDSKEIEIVES